MRKGINNMGSGYIDRVTKYFYEWITKIKIKKSKEDNKKLKELNSKLSKLEKEKEIDYPYVCRNCDENFYDFETIKTK